MKVRLLFRFPDVDSEAKCAGYRFKTEVIECPEEIVEMIKKNGSRPEIVGCEWLEKEASDGTK